MKKVKCGLIGAGYWGTYAHLPALQEHPNAVIMAVQKRDLGQAQDVAKKFGAEYACSSAEELLDIDQLDAVIIASTGDLHYSQAKAALEKGLHVLIEKPVCFEPEQAKELVSIAQAKNLNYIVSCPWNYSDHVLGAKQLIADGKIGEVKMISILFTNFSGGLYKKKTWDEMFGNKKLPGADGEHVPEITPSKETYSSIKKAGGGQITTQLSHTFSLLSWMTSLEAKEVFARFDYDGLAVDLYDTLNLKMSNGALLSIATTGATIFPERHKEVRIYGTKGMIFQELWAGDMYWLDQDGNRIDYPKLDDYNAYPYKAPALNLIDCILGQQANGSPGAYSNNAVEIAKASIESAASNSNIVI